MGYRKTHGEGFRVIHIKPMMKVSGEPHKTHDEGFG